MVSGWDKSPGPDNDYASSAPTKRQTLRFLALVLTIAAVVVSLWLLLKA